MYYICIHKHARLEGGGMLPQEIFNKLDALRLFLKTFRDGSMP